MSLHVTYSERPKTLNGYQVVGAMNHPNCVTVMVQRSEREYIVATWWKALGTSWSWGHYHIDGDGKVAKAMADADFEQTCKRNARR